MKLKPHEVLAGMSAHALHLEMEAAMVNATQSPVMRAGLEPNRA